MAQYSLITFEIREHDNLCFCEIRASESSVYEASQRETKGALTKKTEVKRRTAAMITAKRKSHASPDWIDRFDGDAKE